MPVSLIIEEARHDTKVVTVPDGATVTVRRTDAGADVLVLPASEPKAGPVEAVAGTSKSTLPLDAEQIVRLTGAVLTRVLNASRPADSRAVEEEDLVVALGETAGVPLPIARNEWGIFRLQPYGAVTAPTKDEPASQQPGGSREG